MDKHSNIEYGNKFELSLDNYKKVVVGEKGFLLIPTNENRVILYDEKANKDMQLEDIELDYPKNDSIFTSEKEKIIEEYNMKNKSLIESVFYDTDKNLLFVSYTNEDLAIYNVNDKQLLKLLNKVGKINHYFGKDKYGRMYLGDLSNSYIIDKNYNKVGHIKSLRELKEDKVIISYNSKFYSLKIYTLNDILNEAQEYIRINHFEENGDF